MPRDSKSRLLKSEKWPPNSKSEAATIVNFSLCRELAAVISQLQLTLHQDFRTYNKLASLPPRARRSCTSATVTKRIAPEAIPPFQRRFRAALQGPKRRNPPIRRRLGSPAQRLLWSMHQWSPPWGDATAAARPGRRLPRAGVGLWGGMGGPFCSDFSDFSTFSNRPQAEHRLGPGW